VAELAALVKTLLGQVQQLAASPLRFLPSSQVNPINPAQPVQPAGRIEVLSRFDSLSLLGALCLDQARRAGAIRNGRAYERSEEFMRALLDKVRKIHEAEDKPNLLGGPLRCIDGEAFGAWHAKVPHLRADEAMQSTLAGSGDELVPTLFNSAAWYSFRVESRIFGMLDTFVMPSNPYDYPTITGGPTIRRVSEVTDQSQANLGSSNRPASKPTTAKKTFTALAEGIGALALVSSVLMDDAGLDVAEVLAQQFARNNADAIDYVLANGDEAATATNISHYGVDPTGTAYDKVLILDGLRLLAFSANKADWATLAISDLTTLQKLMGTRGVIGTDLANLVLFIDPGVYYKLKELAEFRTRDKVGETLMTIAKGYVGNWDAIPVVLSNQLEYGDANGRITSAHAGTLGQGLLVHRKICKVGVMRNLTVEAGPVAHTGMFGMSSTVRFDLQQMEAGGVAYGYNTTVA
jgi:HK97 family phage major capsid protein